MLSQSATPTYSFATDTALTLEATFDGGRLTSDGGLPWLAAAEQALGICAAFAACVPEWRRAHIQHSIETLVRQRVFQIACGYEDQNDADTLRTDPLLKVACGRRPESDPDLASQPTLSRLENAVDRHACARLAHALLEVYVRARAPQGQDPPRACSWTSTARTIRRMGSKKGPPTTAITASTCITRCSSLTARRISSSRRCSAPATRMPAGAS